MSDYAIRRVLGAGGFGTVYLAGRVHDDQPVAIKVAHRSVSHAVDALGQELLALEQIGAPAVPAVLDHAFGSSPTTHIVMDYVEGPTLAEWMQSGPRTPEGCRAALIPILRALGRVHDAGFVHGDLKPSNIILGGPLGATLVDLGSARSLLAGSTTTTWNRPAGTIEYMSPEQCTSGAPVDARTDLYALGVVLYELLSGSVPFMGSPEEVKEAHRSHRVPAVDVPEPLADLLRRALAKSPGQRPASAEVFGDDLLRALDACPETLVGSTETSAPRDARPEVAPQRQRVAIGIVWFASTASLHRLGRIVETAGGQLLPRNHDRWVAVFTDTGREHPSHAALALARRLLDAGSCERATVDVGDATCRDRRRGPSRISSGRLEDERWFPQSRDPKGLLLTAAARPFVPSGQFRPTRRPGLLELAALDDDGSVDAGRARPLFGRQTQISEVMASVSGALGGRPSLCTVVGESGMGKSHLVQELLRRVHASPSDAQTALFSPRAGLGGGEAFPVRRLLEVLLGAAARDPRTLRSELESRFGSAFVERHWLGVATGCGWLDAADVRLEKLQAAPGALRSTVAGALGDVLAGLSERGPLLLVIDDAHLVDDAILGAVEVATRREHELPIWICVVFRPECLRARARRSWGAAAGDHRKIELGELDEAAAGAMLRRCLEPVSNVPQWAIRTIFERTHGHPLLLTEFVEGLRRDGLIRRRDRGTGWYLATDVLTNVPDLPVVDWLVKRELAQLEPRLRRFLDLVAIMGSGVTTRDLDGIATRIASETGEVPTVLDAEVGLRKLEALRILEQDLHVYRFRHDMLLRATVDAVPPERATRWHEIAYQWFDTQGRGPVSWRAAHLAHHATAAGMRAEALRHRLELARDALERQEYVQAERTFAQALDACDRTDQVTRLEILHHLGIMRHRLGAYEASNETLEEALQIARDLGDRDREIEILLDSATVWDWRQDFPKAEALARRAEALIEEGASPLLLARVHTAQCRYLTRINEEVHLTCDIALVAAEEARSCGPEGYETRVIALALAAPGLALRGDTEQAEEVFEELIRLCEDHNDAMHLATAYNNRLSLWLAVGECERMFADTARVIDLCRRFGLAELETMALGNAAELHYWEGDLESAAHAGRDAVDLGSRSCGEVPMVLKARTIVARTSLAAGDRDEALAQLEACRRAEPLPMYLSVVVSALGYALEGASYEDWSTLVERAQEFATTQVPDVLEMWGLSALARQDRRTAEHAFSVGLYEALDVPKLVQDRLAAHLRALDPAAVRVTA